MSGKYGEMKAQTRWIKMKETEHFSVFRGTADNRKVLNIAAGKRLGSAVKRNRLKRVLKELFRLHRGLSGNGTAYLIKVKRIPERLSFKDLSDEFLSLFGTGNDEKADNSHNRLL